MSHQSDQQEVLQFLRVQLDAARTVYTAACAEFDSMVKEVPSGIRQPDDALRIQKAGQASRAALQNYMRALKHFADFTLEDV